MKVIKTGKAQSPLLRGKCRACGAVIETTKDEAKLNLSHFGGGPYYTHACPTKKCDNEIHMYGFPWDIESPRERDEKIEKTLKGLDSRLKVLEGKK